MVRGAKSAMAIVASGAGIDCTTRAELWGRQVPARMHGVHAPGEGKGTSYDEIPYPGSAVTTTHPAHVGAIARLFGMAPARPERCRVLELGCGDGANLLPMAHGLPGSEFVGIDLSRKQVDTARVVGREVGLANVRLEAMDIRDAPGLDGPFDYIVCHGVFSWVPAEVREAILDCCRRLLAPQGVAFVSYNALPGWRMRGIVRDLMLFHARHFTEAHERATQARAIVNFAEEASGLIAQSSGRASPFHEYIAAERKLVESRPDYYLLHEFLEDENQAYYLHEFAEMLSGFGLQYLADASFSTMLTMNLPERAGKTIEEISADHLAVEQYRDFVTNRMFRQTLVCRAGVQLNRALSVEPLTEMYFRLGTPPGARPWPEDAAPIPGGGSLAIAAPAAQRMVMALREAFPGVLSFEELRAAAGDEGDQGLPPDEYVGGILFTLLGHDAVDMRWQRPQTATRPGEYPKVSAIARAMAARGGSLPNTMHYAVTFDEFTYAFVPYADGTRDRAALGEVVRELLARPGMTLQSESGPIDASKLEDPDVDGIVDQLLDGLAAFGLLEA